MGCYTYDVGPRYAIVNSEYLTVVEEIQYAWEEDSTLPDLDDCNLSDLYYAVPTPDELYAASYGYYCTANDLRTNCLRVDAFYLYENRVRGRASVDLIVLSPDLDEEWYDIAIAHESLHWLSRCSDHQSETNDVGGFPYRNGDSGHRDPRLWGVGGILNRLGY